MAQPGGVTCPWPPTQAHGRRITINNCVAQLRRATDEKDLMTPELIDERVLTKIDPEEIMSKPGSLGQERRAESLGFRLSFENSNNQLG